MRKVFSLSLNDEKDRDIVEFLDSLDKGYRTMYLKIAVRTYMKFMDSEMEEIENEMSELSWESKRCEGGSSREWRYNPVFEMPALWNDNVHWRGLWREEAATTKKRTKSDFLQESGKGNIKKEWSENRWLISVNRLCRTLRPVRQRR